MKTAVLPLSLFLAATLSAADTAPAAPASSLEVAAEGDKASSKLSPAVSQKVTAGLPAYSPAPPAPPPKPANAPNPDVLELPKITVKQRPRPRLSPEVVYTTNDFNEKLAKEKLSSFDRNVLNKYTLPFFGVSAATRAREEYEREKKAQLVEDVSAVARATEVVDPEAAKSLRDAVNRP